MVASDVSSRSSRIRAACASIRPERRSPPRGPGRAFPCSRCKLRHRLTLAGLTPNRAAASRWLAPAATAARTRTRRSTDKAFDMPAGLHAPAGRLNHISAGLGTPSDSVRLSSALAAADAGLAEDYGYAPDPVYTGSSDQTEEEAPPAADFPADKPE